MVIVRKLIPFPGMRQSQSSYVSGFIPAIDAMIFRFDYLWEFSWATFESRACPGTSRIIKDAA